VAHAGRETLARIFQARRASLVLHLGKGAEDHRGLLEVRDDLLGTRRRSNT